MSRRKGELSRRCLAAGWPNHVLLDWRDGQAIKTRLHIIEHALQLGANPHTRFVMLGDCIWLMFSFVERETALAFRAWHRGEMVELSEIDRLGHWAPAEDGMCNLYNITSNQEAIRALGRVATDILGNLEPSLNIYPDRPAPVIRNTPTGRELALAIWGMPSPSFVTNGNPDSGVTNIRNIASSHWRRWLGPEHRCLVPWTTFCEWEDTKPRKSKRWFAINQDKPLAFFAGIWTSWEGVRGSLKTPRPGRHELFGFLTSEPMRWWLPSTPRPCRSS